jgi:hypothetical protein
VAGGFDVALASLFNGETTDGPPEGGCSRCMSCYGRKRLLCLKRHGTTTGTIDYQVPKNITTAINYVKKEETSVEGKPYLETGELPRGNGRPSKLSKATEDKCNDVFS